MENKLAIWIASTIKEACRGVENNLKDGTGEPAWAEPLVSFAKGDDPLWQQYKEVIDSQHWTPAEAFAQAYPQASGTGQDLTVVAWVLPQTMATRAANRRQDRFPAEQWARSRIYGEAFNNHLRRRLVETLQARGYAAVAPMLVPAWSYVTSEKYTVVSTWSERHAAYAAGLGTFGLCDGLITPRGKAVRVGSVVVRLEVPPSPRPYTDHHAYCLFFANGACRACIDRCPVGAISGEGHDKVRCKAHLNETEQYVWTEFGFEGYGCGLCQTGVPCEAGIPVSGRTPS